MNPIGIYDSGIGGLTVLNELVSQFPYENFVYFADTFHLPYGNKSQEQIIQYSHDIISFFQNTINAKMVIAACNTSSALALDVISNDFHIPIIGTIYPLLGHIHNSKKLGIIATQASADSRMHERIFKSHGFEGEVISVGCPKFTPLIEAGSFDSDELKECATEYLSLFQRQKIDTLVYGCTHYPFIKNLIESLLPESTKYIDPAHYIAQEVKKFMIQPQTKRGSVQYYCSSDPEIFEQKLKRLMNIKNPSVNLRYNKDIIQSK